MYAETDQEPLTGRVHPVPLEVRRRSAWVPTSVLHKLEAKLRDDTDSPREDSGLYRGGKGALRGGGSEE
jgi:hypothetical protein